MSYAFNHLANMCFNLSHTSILSVCSNIDILRRQIITHRFDIIIIIISFLLQCMLINYLSMLFFVLHEFVSHLSCLLSFVICVYMLYCFCNWPSSC